MVGFSSLRSSEDGLRAVAMLQLMRMKAAELERQQVVSSQKAMRRKVVAVMQHLADLQSRSKGMEKKVKRARREVHRAPDKWKGSTMYGYVFDERNDDKTYLLNFRMNRKTFDHVAGLIESSGCRFVPKPGCVQKRSLIPVRFKLGCCLYLLAHGTEVKPAADVGSIGKSTLDLWLDQFQEACLKVLKPIYMPGKPGSPENKQQVRSEFAARRGIPNVAMAVDGSHIPFFTSHGDYRNYKGWYSILVVAFVNAFYLFEDGVVGYPGKAGDNTVLRHCWMLKQIAADREAWLGPNGVILGDSGAGDSNDIIMNPYAHPSTPEQYYFNFCHSSTRFFVEEVFGRWKNRFRFLLCVHDMRHKLHTQLVYATLILHNVCTIHKGNDLSMDVGSDEEWKQFFKSFKRDQCPSCTRANSPHCMHMTRNRERAQGGSHTNKSASAQRDELCATLWCSLCEGEFDLNNLNVREQAQVTRVQEEMMHRVQFGYAPPV